MGDASIYLEGIEEQDLGPSSSKQLQSSFSTSEDDRSADRSPEVTNASSSFSCWGAALMGDASRCDRSFVSEGRHFADKFCLNCSREGCWFHSRVRALLDAAEHEQILLSSNVSAKGCWSHTVAGEAFRIVNCTVRCTGPKLIVFDRPVPQWALDLTEPVFDDNRPHICLRLGYGTLVPDRAAPYEPLIEEAFACWGGALSSDGSKCDINHVPSSRRLDAKFCAHCRSNGFWLSGRTRRLRPGTTAELFCASLMPNPITKGCWNFYLQGVRFRIVNDAFVIFDQPVPQWALAVTEPVFSDDRRDVHVHLKNRKLQVSVDPSRIRGNIPPLASHAVPASSMAHGQHIMLSARPVAGAIEHMTPPVLAMPCQQRATWGAATVLSVKPASMNQRCPALPGIQVPQKTDAGNPAILRSQHASLLKRPFAELASPPCSPPEGTLTLSPIRGSVLRSYAPAPAESRAVGYLVSRLHFVKGVVHRMYSAILVEKEGLEKAILLFESSYHWHQGLTTLPVLFFTYYAMVMPFSRPLSITGASLGLTQFALRYAAGHLQSQRQAFALCGWWNLVCAEVQWLIVVFSDNLIIQIMQQPIWLTLALTTCAMGCNAVAGCLTTTRQQQIAMTILLLVQSAHVSMVPEAPMKSSLSSFLLVVLIIMGALYTASQLPSRGVLRPSNTEQKLGGKGAQPHDLESSSCRAALGVPIGLTCRD